MDIEGFDAIGRALYDAGLTQETFVHPTPIADENVRFVTIETSSDVQPSLVLNALGDAGLMPVKGVQHAIIRRTPELEPLAVQPGSLTFEDLNAPNH